MAENTHPPVLTLAAKMENRREKWASFVAEMQAQMAIVNDSLNKHMEKCDVDKKRVKSQYDEACIDIYNDVKAFEHRIERWRLILQQRSRGPDK